MLEKPRRNFLERSQISLLLLFLSSPLLIFLIFFQVPAIIVSDTGDGQTGGGQQRGRERHLGVDFMLGRSQQNDTSVLAMRNDKSRRPLVTAV